MGEQLRGLGVSGGRVAGPAYRMASAPRLPDAVPAVNDAKREEQRARDALRVVAEQLAELAKHAGKTAGEVLDAEALMAGDPTLARGAAERVRRGMPAAWAVTEAVNEQREMLAGLGGYLAERAADLDDIRDRA